jgi:hypothetical protein
VRHRLKQVTGKTSESWKEITWKIEIEMENIERKTMSVIDFGYADRIHLS